MDDLRSLPLVQASVPRTATFGEAAEVLTSQKVGAIAVLDEKRGVLGLFGGDELIRGLFPGYLSDLRHTAFLRDDALLLADRADAVRGDAVERHMRGPVTVEIETSAMHVAERFLHTGVGALAVVERGEFVGMVDREDFGRVLILGMAGVPGTSAPEADVSGG